MPDKKKTIFNEKFYSWLLVIVFALTFVTAIMLSLTLPFVNVKSEVASAYDWTGPLLSDLSNGDVIYGFKITSRSDFNSYLANKGVPVNSYSTIYFRDGAIDYVLTLNCKDVAGGTFSLFIDYQDYGYTTVFGPVSVIASADGGDYSGCNYWYSDVPLTLSSDYSNSTPAESALWDCPYLQCLTTPLNQGWSPEAFATRFVTPTDSPSNTVFFNLSTMPKAPKLADFQSYSSGSMSWYYYDYFVEYGADGSSYGANDVNTVGWHVSVHKEVLPPETTILGYYVYLRVNTTDIYSYYVTGSNFDTGAISEQKWLVSSNYTFGDLKLYKYDFSGATSYYSLLPHVDGKTRPIDSQFGETGWSSWLALFDLSNFASLSNDVYINMGYSQAKAYYDELIKTKSQESFLQGKALGYDLGYQEGKLEGGDYTFTSLIGAVFDAPISAFRGLFNFEILGVNMQGFVLALLTLSVIIIVIRFALGGK